MNADDATPFDCNETVDEDGVNLSDISDVNDEICIDVDSKKKRKRKRKSYQEDSSASTDVVRSVSEYNQIRKRHGQNSECTLKYGELDTEELLTIYHSLPKNHPDKQWIKDEAFLRTFFLIPYVFKRHYCMPLTIFDDAVMNMAQMVLVAIEKYRPGLGASFANYLYGPFKAAVAKTLHDTNVVAIPPARRKLLRQAMDRVDENSEELAEYTGILPDMPVPYEGTYEAQDVSVDYEEEIHKLELVEWAEEAIETTLTADERRLLVMHYGLFGHKCVPYKEIAKLRAEEGKGSAHSRLSQIHTQALEKLRARFRDLGLEEW